eukprot:TRINITY_DN74134_c0_g1_i1.p1 TRINITY_DN74134_c0_g1~~TRINITY_DN74134_c0_g1_i1.p1  ORF type:complete len:531 (+),score=75.55 TRINITY_DN74134_c0_g1_i1:138-1730(+)
MSSSVASTRPGGALQMSTGAKEEVYEFAPVPQWLGPFATSNPMSGGSRKERDFSDGGKVRDEERNVLRLLDFDEDRCRDELMACAGRKWRHPRNAGKTAPSDVRFIDDAFDTSRDTISGALRSASHVSGSSKHSIFWIIPKANEDDLAKPEEERFKSPLVTQLEARLEMCIKVHGILHRTTVVALFKLAELYIIIGVDEQAVDCLGSAVSLLSLIDSRYTMKFASRACGYAQTLARLAERLPPKSEKQRKTLKLAIEQYFGVLEVVETCLGPSNAEVCFILCQLANANLLLGKTELSNKQYMRAMAMRQSLKLSGEDELNDAAKEVQGTSLELYVCRLKAEQAGGNLEVLREIASTLEEVTNSDNLKAPGGHRDDARCFYCAILCALDHQDAVGYLNELIKRYAGNICAGTSTYNRALLNSTRGDRVEVLRDLYNIADTLRKVKAAADSLAWRSTCDAITAALEGGFTQSAGFNYIFRTWRSEDITGEEPSVTMQTPASCVKPTIVQAEAKVSEVAPVESDEGGSSCALT